MRRYQALILLCGGMAGCAASLDQRLGSEDAQVQSSAVTKFNASSPASQAKVVEKLAKLLSNSDQHKRAEAAGALMRIGYKSKSAVPELTRALNDSYDEVRKYAANALKIIETEDKARAKSATLQFIGRLVNENGRNPETVEALVRMGSNAVPELIKILTNSEFHKDIAAMILGRIGPKAKAAVPALIKVLNVNEKYGLTIWGPAIEALGRMGPAAATAIPALVKVSNNPSFGSYTQEQAIEALKELGPAGKAVASKTEAQRNREAVQRNRDLKKNQAQFCPTLLETLRAGSRGGSWYGDFRVGQELVQKVFDYDCATWASNQYR